MPLTIKAEKGGVSVYLPPGTYPVICMDVQADKLENSQFGTGDVVRFDLEVQNKMDPEGNPVHLDPIANFKLTPKSKLWGWLQGFGLKFEVGEEIDIEQVVGHEAFAVVVDKPATDGSGAVFSSVDNIVPAPSTQATRNLMDISDFWAEVRDTGFSVKEATDKGHELYQKHPKDLDLNQRTAVIQALST